MEREEKIPGVTFTKEQTFFLNIAQVRMISCKYKSRPVRIWDVTDNISEEKLEWERFVFRPKGVLSLSLRPTSSVQSSPPGPSLVQEASGTWLGPGGGFYTTRRWSLISVLSDHQWGSNLCHWASHHSWCVTTELRRLTPLNVEKVPCLDLILSNRTLWLHSDRHRQQTDQISNLKKYVTEGSPVLA